MYFLVDLENVHNAGMSGISYLDEHDTLILFFGETARTLEHRNLEGIAQSGCVLETYRLKNIGKNALDFCIATRVGEILQIAPNENIAIISRDRGYKAVQEYVQNHSKPCGRLICSESIERAIIASNTGEKRTKEVRRQLRTESIESFAAQYTERQRIIKRLHEQFDGSEFESMLPEILAILSGEDQSAKVIYLDSLKRFGRKNGVSIYRRLKNCAIF